MDIDHYRLPIIKKEETVKEIENYKLDKSNHNVYYATLLNNEKLFLLEISNSKLIHEKNNLNDVIEVKHKNILSLLYIMNKNLDQSYLCFEYSDNLLSNYIECISPHLVTRLNLLKQCTQFILHFKNNNIKLDNLDNYYIFVNDLIEPTLKILYHGILF